MTSKSRKKWIAAAFALLVLAALITAAVVCWPGYRSADMSETPVFNPLKLLEYYEGERDDGGYYTLVDERGETLLSTSLMVYPGDEFIDRRNQCYRVIQVEGDTAWCEIMRVEPAEREGVYKSGGIAVVTAIALEDKPVVGIYNTHGGESYIPSEGKRVVQGRGGITKVSASLSEKLQSLGVSTLYNDEPHTSSGRNSYRFSRRTAADLIGQGAAVLIDVHRDAAPASEYITKMDGQMVAGVLLVVGRQNPQYAANLGFAEHVKALVDQKHPDLIKGIFKGRGMYNQDLSPASLLIEVGSQSMPLEQAVAGVNLFAESIPEVLETSPVTGVAKIKSGSDKGGSWKSLGLILVALLTGTAGYLYLSTGSWPAALEKLRQFRYQEFRDLFARIDVDKIKLRLTNYLNSLKVLLAAVAGYLRLTARSWAGGLERLRLFGSQKFRDLFARINVDRIKLQLTNYLNSLKALLAQLAQAIKTLLQRYSRLK